MAVVKNLMVRIGADFSEARKGMQGATRELDRFKRDTTRSTATIRGKNGLGGVGVEFKGLGNTVMSSLSRMRGAKGIGGVVSELRTLGPALGTASKGMMGFGGATATAGAAATAAGITVAAFVAVIGLATVGIYHASQAAVKFEADIGRLNMALKSGSREYMAWAKSAGIAKSTASELGATYGILLSGFIKDTDELKNQTTNLVHATRVIASATGRSLEDTFQRVRSGMLGSTEAIEDLGVYVNVSMIESTKAFKRFAGDKSWAQLNFQTQQQIRLAAILEQTYARYGDNLQNNVMTKQEKLMEQMKDIKLNLSQAFMPIWDSIIPSLRVFAHDLAVTTEQLARFTYWLRGWDYDEMTSGTDKQTDSVIDLGDSLGDTEKQAKKTYKALAAFDEINQIGESDDDSGGSGGTGSGGGVGGMPNVGSDDLGDYNFPNHPPMNMKKWRIEFDPPNPPDAGAGAAATAITSTMNDLIADTKQKFGQMWGDLQVQSQAGAASQQVAWSNLWSNLGNQDTIGQTNRLLTWSQMHQQLMVTNALFKQNVELSNSELWLNLNNQTITGREALETEWSGMAENISTETKSFAESVKFEWHGALDFMQNKLNAYRPFLEWGWYLLGDGVLSIKPALADADVSWSTALSNMLNAITEKTAPILSRIEAIKSAWASMMAMVGTPIQFPTIQLPKIELPDMSHLMDPVRALGDSMAPAPQANPLPGRNLPVIGQLLRSLDFAGGAVEESGVGALLRSVLIPGASLAGAGSAASGSGAQVGSLLNKLRQMLQGSGIAVPAFAKGGIVTGPTLAMIGEAGTEAVIPLEDTSFVDTIASAIGTAVLSAQQAAQGSHGRMGDIIIQTDGVAWARVHLPYLDGEQQRIGNTAIIQPT